MEIDLSNSPIRGTNPVDVQECYEYIVRIQKHPGMSYTNAKLFEDIKKCLCWVESNG